MANINLLQKIPQKKEGFEKIGISNKGAGISLVILFVALIGLVILKIYVGNLDKKVLDVNGKISVESLVLKGNDADHIADVQTRLEKIKSNVDSMKNPENILKELEKNMVQGVALKSFENKESAVSVLAVTNSFTNMAKQILSFKESKYFKGIKVTTTERDKEGKISFGLDMKIE